MKFPADGARRRGRRERESQADIRLAFRCVSYVRGKKRDLTVRPRGSGILAAGEVSADLRLHDGDG